MLFRRAGTLPEGYHLFMINPVTNKKVDLSAEAACVKQNLVEINPGCTIDFVDRIFHEYMKNGVFTMELGKIQTVARNKYTQLLNKQAKGQGSSSGRRYN